MQTLVHHCTLEILLIDDGSTDQTSLVAYQLTQEIAELTYIRLTRNFGKEAALTAGLQHAKGEAVIMVDADGQHPPEVLLTFIALWQQGYEVVYGQQAQREEGGFIKFCKHMYYGLMQRFATIVIPSNAGDFRLLDRKTVNSLNMLTENNRYMKGLYAWVGYRSISVPYKARKRHAGKTTFSLFKLVTLGLAGLTGFSVLPLRLVSFLGLVISAIAFCFGIEILVHHLIDHNPVPGWPTLAVGMMFFAGIELLALGVIGEYVGNIFEEVIRRPLYLVAESVGKNGKTVTAA
jgi:glycosyltransferase involved in cell wall biosynthesis